MVSMRTWDRRAMLTGLGALSAAPAFAQTRPADPAVAGSTLMLSNIYTRMAARVGVNGRERFVFVIDTGAGRTSVSDRVAAEMGLPRGPDVLVHGVTEAVLTPTVRLTRFDFGGQRFHSLLAPVFPADQLAADGLVGLDVLSRFRLNFDQRLRRITIAPSGGEVVDTSETFYEATRMTRQGGSVAVDRFGQLVLLNAFAERQPIHLFVDTGAQFSIGNRALLDLVDRFRPPTQQHQRIEVFGVTGQSALAEVAQVQDLRIGRSRMGTTTLLFSDLHAFRELDLIEPPALLMGADLLTRFRHVVLDFGRGRMSFSGLRRSAPAPGYIDTP